MDSQSEWYFVVETEETRQQEGPVPTRELEEMLSSGRIFPATLVWCDGMADWEPISAVSLFSAFLPAEETEAIPEPVPDEAPEAVQEPIPDLVPEAAAEPVPEMMPEVASPEPDAEEIAAVEPAPDTVTIKELGDHSVRYSRSRNTLQIVANDERAGQLELTKLDLLGFLTSMELLARGGESGAAGT